MSLKTRLARIEEAVTPKAAPVFTVQVDDGPVRVNGEEMTRGAFEDRYPDGRIIHVEIVNCRYPRHGSTSTPGSRTYESP